MVIDQAHLVLHYILCDEVVLVLGKQYRVNQTHIACACDGDIGLAVSSVHCFSGCTIGFI